MFPDYRQGIGFHAVCLSENFFYLARGVLSRIEVVDIRNNFIVIFCAAATCRRNIDIRIIIFVVGNDETSAGAVADVFAHYARPSPCDNRNDASFVFGIPYGQRVNGIAVLRPVKTPVRNKQIAPAVLAQQERKPATVSAKHAPYYVAFFL